MSHSNPYEGIMFPVKATVITGCGGGCRVQHGVGQTWYMRGVPAGICSFAFQAMFPAYWTLRFGGIDPNEANPDQMHVACERAGCVAQFRLERISAEEAATLQQAMEMISVDDLLASIPAGLSKRVK
jgi:uncharacterized repeat protein (TIGR04076 family)